MPIYQKGDVRIRYEEVGSGFPLLVSRAAVELAGQELADRRVQLDEEFKNDFRCITMDQRNANEGESSGPMPVEEPWGAFADDQLALMDHLGIHKFFFMGYCIGGSFALKILERAPDRVVAGVFCQTVGHLPEDRTLCTGPVTTTGLPISRAAARRNHGNHRSICTTSTVCSLISCTACRAISSELPHADPGIAGRHAVAPAADLDHVASLAPNAEIMVFPWREPEELRQRMINKVRNFLKSHIPMRAAAQ